MLSHSFVHTVGAIISFFIMVASPGFLPRTVRFVLDASTSPKMIGGAVLLLLNLAALIALIIVVGIYVINH